MSGHSVNKPPHPDFAKYKNIVVVPSSSSSSGDEMHPTGGQQAQPSGANLSEMFENMLADSRRRELQRKREAEARRPPSSESENSGELQMQEAEGYLTPPFDPSKHSYEDSIRLLLKDHMAMRLEKERMKRKMRKEKRLRQTMQDELKVLKQVVYGLQGDNQDVQPAESSAAPAAHHHPRR